MHRLAKAVAIAAHQAVGQKRKYGGLDYYTHPFAVADILYTEDECIVTNEDFGANDISMEMFDSMLAAALLHDVVEDTQVKLSDLKLMGFTTKIIELVDQLTDPAKDPEKFGNRETRNKINFEHTRGISTYAKAVKCCDIMHNTSTLLEAEPKFAKLYISEKLYIAREALFPTEDSCKLHLHLHQKMMAQLLKLEEAIAML